MSIEKKPRRRGPMPGEQRCKPGEKKRIDEWWERLKKKHAGKSRLKKSIKPPIFLNFPELRKKRAAKAGEE